MAGTEGFLVDKMAKCDLVMIEVVGLPQPQCVKARVERVYAARNGVEVDWCGRQIEFVGSPPHWGQMPLAAGDVALVFLKSIGGRLYEGAWHGHMFVEEIDHERYVVFQHREIWLSPTVPESLRVCSRQDPKRAFASAIPLAALDAYLAILLENADRGAPPTVAIR